MFPISTPSTQEVHTGKPLKNCNLRCVATFKAEDAKYGPFISYGGAAYLLNGRVVLLDTDHNRCCLYNEDEISAEIKLSSKPHSVTHMGNNRIAVSLPEEDMIQVLEVESRSVFRFERNVYTDWPCHALASAGDDMIVVCYMKKGIPEVVMINLDGQKKRLLYTGKHDGTGEEEIHIAYDKLRKRTCVFDKKRNEIRVILKDGSERFKYPDYNLQLLDCSNGIDFDQEGNLYYTSLQFGICQLSPNGDPLNNFAGSFSSPTTLCFQPNGRDFIVATDSGEVYCFVME